MITMDSNDLRDFVNQNVEDPEETLNLILEFRQRAGSIEPALVDMDIVDGVKEMLIMLTSSKIKNGKQAVLFLPYTELNDKYALINIDNKH